MEVLDHLAVALGLATLAGLNLYLVVFVTGLAIRFQWVELFAQHEILMPLAHPAVIAVSGGLFLIEALADKVPWLDSLWDSVHTFIRPTGGALLAISALGETKPEFSVIVALVAGGTTLVSHSFKSGSRLLVNSSPEPASNTIVSLTEDVAVIGGFALMAAHPRIAACVFVVFLIIAIYLLPKFYRRITGFYWLVSKTIGGWIDSSGQNREPGLKPEEDMALMNHFQSTSPPRILWTAGAVTGRIKGLEGVNIRPFCRGKLVGVDSNGERRLYFVGRRLSGIFCLDLNCKDCTLSHEARTFCDYISIYDRQRAFIAEFRIPSGNDSLAAKVFQEMRSLKHDGETTPPPLPA